MVFYFSGTGNSYHVAKKLAEGLGEKMIDMARATREDAYEYTLKKGEKLGFVFPVHAWAPPQMVEQFVQRLELYYEEDVYTYAVCTCGQSAGETMSILEASLEANDLSLDSGYSVIMPDNYAVLFKAPSPETQRHLLRQADEIVQLILRAVKLERKDFFRVKKGKGGTFLSNEVNPLFRRFATKTKPFYPTVDCIGCGICEKTCTASAIHVEDNCAVIDEASCLSCGMCAVKCPQHAIYDLRGIFTKVR